MANTVLGFAKPALLATPTKVGGANPTQLAPSQSVPSSTTQPAHPSRAQADSSRKEKVCPFCPPTNAVVRLFPPTLLFVP